MSTLKTFLSVLLIIQTAYARSFNPCELENELQSVYKLTIEESRNLTCIAQKFSRLHTNVVAGRYYGIFQIKNSWCGIEGIGGECNIKCTDLLDDDISDDILCAQKIFLKLGKRAWRLNKSPGCREEFKYLDENCYKEISIDDERYQVQQDFCVKARELMTLYDISKIDAIVWSCISTYSKTGNINSQIVDNVDNSCVRARDVECAIKNYKQTGINGFTNWPVYDKYCRNISESTCFEMTLSKSLLNKNKIRENIEDIKNHKYIDMSTTNQMTKLFTTSTEISLIVEDEYGRITHYTGADVTTESFSESQQTTEFLSNTLEKPSDDEKSTIEGYSKVRIMSADKSIAESHETLKSTTENLDDNLKQISISNSLLQSTTESMKPELPKIEYTIDNGIAFKYFDAIDKCSLAKDMKNSGRLPDNLISTFICIAEHESGLNLSFVNTDGLQSRYGLFQIDNQIYCSTNDKINQCDVLCAHLVDDQFDNDFECIRHIYKKEGLNYWPAYDQYCKNVHSNSLDFCYEKFTTSHRPFIIINNNYEENSSKISTEITTQMFTEFSNIQNTTEIYKNDSEYSKDVINFCEFSHELLVNASIDLNDLPYHLCIIGKTHILKGLNNNRENSFGIFGLRNNTCGNDNIGGLCSISCSSLMDDDYIDDARCVSIIFREYGLSEWNITKKECIIFKTKLLECIDDEKFSVPSDDDEIDLKTGIENISVNTRTFENKQQLSAMNSGIDQTTNKLINLEDTTIPFEVTKFSNNDIEENETTTEILRNSDFTNTEDKNDEQEDTTTILHTTTEQSSLESSTSLESNQEESLENSTIDSSEIYTNSNEDSEVDLEKNLVITTEGIETTEYPQHNDEKLLTTELTESTENTNEEEITERSMDLETTPISNFVILNKPVPKVNRKDKLRNFEEEDYTESLNSEVTTTEYPFKEILGMEFTDDILMETTTRNLDIQKISVEKLDRKEKSEKFEEDYGSSLNNVIKTTEYPFEDTLNIEMTDEYLTKSTTEGLFYTSIREIIEEYEKANVKMTNEAKILKRDHNYSYDETTENIDYSNEDSTTKEDFNLFPIENDFDEVTTEIDSTTLEGTSLKIFVNETDDYPLYLKIDECSLALYMNDSIFPKNLIPFFVCIAQHESKFNISSVTVEGLSKKVLRYGLFQIDDDIYCNANDRINVCDVMCTELNDMELDDDFKCINKIYYEQGLSYWPSYEKSCKNVDPNYLDYCYEEFRAKNEPAKIDNKENDPSEIYSTTENVYETTEVTNIQDSNLLDIESENVIKSFNTCELAQLLLVHNISFDDIPTYLCIADRKSQLKIKIPNANEQNYGLFFINSQFCGHNEADGLCSILCSELWDDDITDDIECVQIIDESNYFVKWNLTANECLMYTRKVLECFDKNEILTIRTPKNKEKFNDRNETSSEINYDVITDSNENIEDLFDKVTISTLAYQSKNTRDTEIDEDEEPTTTIEPQIIDQTIENILKNFITTTQRIKESNDAEMSTTEESLKEKKASVDAQNVASEVISFVAVTNGDYISKEIEKIISDITNSNQLPKNGSVIVNIFNFNIIGDKHNIKYSEYSPATNYKKDEN